MLFDYLIAAAIGFAGMLGVLHVGTTIITLNEQTFQITMADTILRELSALSLLVEATPATLLQSCKTDIGVPSESFCRMVLETLPALPDHRVQVLAGGALELSWIPASGDQLTVTRMPERW